MSKTTKMKVMTIVGTRPEVIRLSRVISKLDLYCDHVLVHTGQNYDYELNEIFFQDLSIRPPDIFLEVAASSGAESIGEVIIQVDKILSDQKPDAILILGDTNSCMSVIPAKRHRIPIFHMEAGNRCFDDRVPEEINRRIIDHTADINLTYSSIAREYLLREGLPPDRIIKTGSPMKEVIEYYKNDIQNSKVLSKLKLKKNQFFLVSAHREENVSNEVNFYKLINILNSIAVKFKLPVIVSTHPRTAKEIKEKKPDLENLISLIAPLSFTDYNHLQIASKITLSDSGTISEESSIQNFKALNIRETHERPEAFEEASVMMVGLEEERVMQGIEILSLQKLGDQKIVHDYSFVNVSDKVVKIIISYSDYVRKNTWKDI
jgi:UDP-N-acetylglucosamine 2-epimerase (non-hydrolysing)